MTVPRLHEFCGNKVGAIVIYIDKFKAILATNFAKNNKNTDSFVELHGFMVSNFAQNIKRVDMTTLHCPGL